MRSDMSMETINLVKTLKGTYKQADKEMVIKIVGDYKEKNNCSYKAAYEMTVEGNPSFSAYSSWRRKLKKKEL
ncbi:MAG: hypothetical protein Q9M43_12455 [Sulfurimonas sp.]|nr:hypothetical protein [Sulfurimonas sp.]